MNQRIKSAIYTLRQAVCRHDYSNIGDMISKTNMRPHGNITEHKHIVQTAEIDWCRKCGKIKFNYGRLTSCNSETP